MRQLDFLLTQKEDGRRVGRLVTSLCGVSSGMYAKLKAQNAILLDGQPAHADVRARAGQRLTIMLPEEAKEENSVQTASVNLSICYRDDDFIIIDKPAPLPTMRSPHQSGASLDEYVKEYLGEFRPVNRLDKGTSGLMVIARSAYAQSRLQSILHTDDFIREYMAVIDGVIMDESGVIDLPIGRNTEGVRRVITENGKESVTEYWKIKSGSRRTLVRLRLQTGRTHQIRVHMAAMGHPVTGDYLYGSACAELPGRFALHSTFLSLLNPITNKRIECESKPPEIFEDLIESSKESNGIENEF